MLLEGQVKMPGGELGVGLKLEGEFGATVINTGTVSPQMVEFKSLPLVVFVRL